MSEKIKAVLVEPGKEAKITEIGNTLQNFQKQVGGYIECVFPFEDCDVSIICNAEGKYGNLEPNRTLRDNNGEAYDVVFGTFIITGSNEDDFGSLTDEQAEYYLEMFCYPEVFVSTKKDSVILKVGKAG